MDRKLIIEGLRVCIAAKQEEIEQARQAIKSLSEELAEETRLHEQEQRQIAFKEAQERGRIWQETDPEGHAAFLNEIRERNRQAVLGGAKCGWWDVDENGEMLAPPIVVNSAELPENAAMAHVMAAVGIFPSVSQARKQGWGKPLTKGIFTVTKKKIRIRVI